MTDPSRWSDPSSEVDAVVRSVLRYARDVAPPAEHTLALLRRVQSAAEARPQRRPTLRAMGVRRLHAWAFAACLTVGFGGIALGAYVAKRSAEQGPSSAAVDSTSAGIRESKGSLGSNAPAPGGMLDLGTAPDEMPPPTSTASSVSSSVSTEPSSAAILSPEPSKRPVPSSIAILSPEPSKTRRLRAAPPSNGSGNAGSLSSSSSSDDRASVAHAAEESETITLHAARAALSIHPQRTLWLVRAHAMSFPVSSLAEERSALELEALARLGRSAEAEAALERFESQYPRSPYRRRLRALLSE